MRKVLLALTATFAVCLAVFAGTTMCVKKQNGDILRINVDDVYEVYFEDIFNPDTSAIIPPFIEPTVADTSAYAPLRFRITSDSTVELTDGNYRDLDSVNIPAKVKIDGKVYSVTKIGDYALCPKYSDCYGLISVAIPSSVTSIGYDAFSGCSSLTTIEIPSSVTSIGSYAFAWCENLDVVIDNSRKNIEIRMNAFIDCHSLTFKKDPIMDSSVDDALISSFDYEILADSTAKIIEYHYYDYDNKIDSMTMPSKVVIDNNIYNVSSVGGHTFMEIEAPSHIIIPEGITSIVDYAFRSVLNLKSVSLPSSVTSIGSEAFRYCSSLESINVDAKNPNYSSLDGVVYNKEKTEIIAVPEGIKGSISIPSSVTEIGSDAFRDCSSLESINVDAKNPNYSSLDGIVYNKEKTEIIAVPNGIKGSISIPESVTSIGSEAFFDCSRLTSIAIPSSVTSIGSSAFRYCSSMTSVEIPSSVASIGSNAFRDCKNLDVVIDNSKENVKFYNYWEKETTIENSYAFEGVKSVKWLKEIDEDPSVADVSVYAPLRFEITSDSTVELTYGEDWESYRDLVSVNIPSKVKIDGKVYSVTSIVERSFHESSSLTSITIPESVTNIEWGAFNNCKNLNVVIANTRKNVSIKKNSFTLCKSVTFTKDPKITNPSITDALTSQLDFEITSDSTVQIIGCDSIACINSDEIKPQVLIEGKLYDVTSIKNMSLTSWSATGVLIIPSSILKIEGRLVNGLDSVYVDENNPNYTSLNGIIYNKEKTEIIYIPRGIKGSIHIPEGVTEIGSYAFSDCSSLKSIEIPSSVTSIGSYAFSDCGSLESINVDVKNSIYSSLDGIIYNKEKTEIIYVPREIKGSIHIPEGVTSIGSYAFYDCSSLKSIEIPSSVTSIGSYAFSDCSSLESINVDVKNSIYSSLDGIIYNKEKTEIIYVPREIKGSIHIPEGVTSIGSYAFYDCSSLTSIAIPSSVTSIGERAFYSCSSLESINVDAKNPNYSSLDGILYNKDKTEIIAVPNGIKGIFSIPSSVTSIGGHAFYYCRSLTSVEIPSSVTSIGKSAFYYCRSLTSVEIPSSVTSIGSDAFYNCENLDVVIDNSEENVEVGYGTFKGVKSVKWLK